MVQARTTATIRARARAVREVSSRRQSGPHGRTLVVLDAGILAASAAAGARACHEQAPGQRRRTARGGHRLTLARASHDHVAALQARRSAAARSSTRPRRRCAAPKRGSPARLPGSAGRVRRRQRPSHRRSGTHDGVLHEVAAPFSGMIAEKIAEAGNMATPGVPLLRLEGTREFRLEVRVDDRAPASSRRRSRPGHPRNRRPRPPPGQFRDSAAPWMRMPGVSRQDRAAGAQTSDPANSAGAISGMPTSADGSSVSDLRHGQSPPSSWSTTDGASSPRQSQRVRGVGRTRRIRDDDSVAAGRPRRSRVSERPMRTRRMASPDGSRPPSFPRS